MNKVYKNKYNADEFSKKFHLQTTLDLVLLILLALFFWSAWSEGISNWIKYTVLSAYLAFIILNIGLYPSTKKIVQEFKIVLGESTLGVWLKDDLSQMPYSDLKISKVIRRDEKVVEIHLVSTFNNKMKLENLEDMDDLYENLKTKFKLA